MKNKKKTWEEELNQKINSVIAYAVNGECGGVTVKSEKQRLVKFINQTIKEEMLEILEEIDMNMPSYFKVKNKLIELKKRYEK